MQTVNATPLFMPNLQQTKGSETSVNIKKMVRQNPRLCLTPSSIDQDVRNRSAKSSCESLAVSHLSPSCPPSCFCFRFQHQISRLGYQAKVETSSDFFRTETTIFPAETIVSSSHRGKVRQCSVTARTDNMA